MKRLILSTLAACLLAASTLPSWAGPQPKIEVFFSPKGGCTEAVVTALARATNTVLVQAYSFTSAPIAKALVDAHKRGVRIQVILDKSQRTEKYSEADFTAHAGIPTFIDAKHAIAHNKIMVIDGHEILTGSFNFTKEAEEHNAENLLVIEDAPLRPSTRRIGRSISSTPTCTGAGEFRVARAGWWGRVRGMEMPPVVSPETAVKVPVHEVFNGQTVWHGDVEVFDLTGHPKAKRAYAWSHLDGPKDEARAVRGSLGNPPGGISGNSRKGSNRQGRERKEMSDRLIRADFKKMDAMIEKSRRLQEKLEAHIANTEKFRKKIASRHPGIIKPN